MPRLARAAGRRATAPFARRVTRQRADFCLIHQVRCGVTIVTIRHLLLLPGRIRVTRPGATASPRRHRASPAAPGGRRGCGCGGRARRPVRIMTCGLPVKSAWLNNAEPKWMLGKKAILEPQCRLSGTEAPERVCSHFGCACLEPLEQNNQD